MKRGAEEVEEFGFRGLCCEVVVIDGDKYGDMGISPSGSEVYTSFCWFGSGSLEMMVGEAVSVVPEGASAGRGAATGTLSDVTSCLMSFSGAGVGAESGIEGGGVVIEISTGMILGVCSLGEGESAVGGGQLSD